MNDFDNIKKLHNKFNWGAFFLGWIWGLLNNTYIALIQLPIAFIPKLGGLISLGLAVFFGIKGNEWALKNKKFDSELSFIKYQKVISIAGLLVFSTLSFLAFAGIELSALHPAGYDYNIIKVKILIYFTILMLIYIVSTVFMIKILRKKD